MTHEQKPESAELWTREDQIETMTVHYMEAGFPINAARRLARDGVAEAEARGAAEQRQKDEPEFEKIIAERDEAEDFIRKMAETVLGEAVEWSNVYGFQNALNDVSERIFFLEKEAANVAALEARVKELEGVLRNVRDAIEKSDPKVLVCTLWMTWPSETVVDYISAAIREGGEHG